jgi:sortase (surface protein transpeptidase)
MSEGRVATLHRRRRTLVFDTVVVGLALAGTICLTYPRVAASGTPPVRVSGRLTSTSAPGPSSPASTARVAVPEPEAPPAQLSIPAIGVQTPLTPLGLGSDGTLQVPSDPSVAGWYALGPRPGEPGASVIAGHVDSWERPAVFYRLGELSPGNLVRIALTDGTLVRFRVYAVREFAKAAFPSSLVYGPTQVPELRLITCGGPWDTQTGHYLDNVVVFARYAGRDVLSRSPN